MSSLACDIVTPEAKLMSGDYYMVVVPGVEGEMGFLEGHSPLVSALSDGVIRLRKEAGSDVEHIAMQGGYVEVTGEKVIVLADRACLVKDIVVEDVKAEREAALSQIEALSADEAAAKSTLDATVAWCDLRLKAVSA